ncbi:ACP S-malonyltransferase, partial [Angustibacter aerolatus]
RATQQAFDAAAPARLALVVPDAGTLHDRLPAAVRGLGAERPLVPVGVHLGLGDPAPGGIGFVLPGQGAQHVGMSGDVTCHVPAAQDVWDRYGATEVAGQPLHRVVLPPPARDDDERAEQQRLLTRTECAQPALAVHSLVLLEVLGQLGLRPDAVAGHSFGELVALHVAGALTADDLVELAGVRGRAMRDAAAGTDGVMVAALTEPAQVERALARAGRERVWVANRNGPRQVVLSGAADDVAAVVDDLSVHGVETRALQASTAFHTPVVADAVPRLLEHLAGVDVRPPRLPVLGNADAAPYPADPAAVRRRLAEQLTGPVRFVDDVEAMYALGVRTFVEVGAGSALTGLVGQVLAGREHLAVALDHPARHGVTALQQALAALAARGVPMDHDRLWAPFAPTAPTSEEPTMTVQLDGTGTHAPAPARVPDVVRLDLPAATPATRADDAFEVDAAPGAAALVELQRQAAETHLACQQLLADNHAAYLHRVRAAVAALTGGRAQPAQAGQPAAPAPTQLTRSVSSAQAMPQVPPAREVAVPAVFERAAAPAAVAEPEPMPPAPWLPPVAPEASAPAAPP